MILALVILASIFKSVADTLAHHFDTSVFKKLNPSFWDANNSKGIKIPLTQYKLDAWHLCNSGMIVCFIIGASFFKSFNLFGYSISGWIGVLFYGIVFNLVFGLFYTHILRRK